MQKREYRIGCEVVKVFGYQIDRIELQEVTFVSNLEELNKLIKFLQEVKVQHSKVIGECHSHFRDWDSAWKDDTADIIVVTTPKC